MSLSDVFSFLCGVAHGRMATVQGIGCFKKRCFQTVLEIATSSSSAKGLVVYDCAEFILKYY